MNKKIVVAIAGSSGAVYAQRLLTKLSKTQAEVAVVMSDNAVLNWELEIGPFKSEDLLFPHYKKNDFSAPFASGSARFETMIVCPCSMGLLGRIATGISNDLITRAADVILKERRKLILVPRETPYNLIHINNMAAVSQAGAIVCPATPSFYAQPKTVTEVVDTVVDRILDLADVPVDTFRWGAKK